MATPITWRNVDAPSFSAQGLNAASDLFRGAQSGFDVFTGRMREGEQLEDQRLTNEAIMAALNGGPQVSNNRRVDSKALYDITSSERALKDDLLTSQTGRDLTKAQTVKAGADTDYTIAQTAAQKFANDHALESFNQEIAESNSNILKNKAQVALDQYNLMVAKDGFDTEKAERSGAKAINEYTDHIRELKRQELLNQLPEGVKPEPEDLARIAQEVDAFAYGIQGQILIDSFAQKNKIGDGAKKKSRWGEIEARAAANADAITQAAADRANQRAEDEARRGTYEAQGNFDLTLVNPETGFRYTGTKDELAAEKMTTVIDGIQGLATYGVPTSAFRNKEADDPEMETLTYAVKALKNKSLLAGSIAGFMDSDGDFDHKGFRKALDQALANGRFDAINKARQEKGLAPLEINGSGSGGGSFGFDGSDTEQLDAMQLRDRLR